MKELEILKKYIYKLREHECEGDSTDDYELGLWSAYSHILQVLELIIEMSGVDGSEKDV
ncbi:hypothetical protein HZY86_01205 [Aerococcaceae bacterium DSM 111020]|nr:hypothetical protein [Aerococcaceae bacterium DSM 111020]